MVGHAIIVSRLEKLRVLANLEFFLFQKNGTYSYKKSMLMNAAGYRRTNMLLVLVLMCLTGLYAQRMKMAETAFPGVQRFSLEGVNASTPFVSLDSAALTVFVFLSPECPLCKNYSLVLNALTKQFSNDVAFYGIVPGRAYSKSDVQKFIDDYTIRFPVWIDVQKELSSYVRATVTPEVVLLTKTGHLVYRGAIDDWVQALGQKKAKAQKHYLEEAISRRLQKKEVPVKQTTPIGCLINEF